MDAAVDAAVDAMPDASGTGVTLTIDVFGDAPALIAYRDGATAPWQTPTKTSTGYEITVHGPYVLSYTCANATTTPTVQTARTLDDSRSLFTSCGVTTRATVHVTGHMVQAGSVTLGPGFAQSTTPGWDFDLEVEPGTHDLIATGNDRIEIRRDVAITAATTVTPDVDVAARGVALDSTTFTATGALPDDTLTVLVGFNTAHSFALLPTLPAVLASDTVPASALIAGDVQKLLISAFGHPPQPAQPTRSVRRRWAPGQSTELALPARLGPVSYDLTGKAVIATWSTVPDFNEVDLLLSAHSGTARFWSISVRASQRFIQATAPHIVADIDIPGFRPQWRIDFTNEYRRDLTTVTPRGATRDDQDEVTASETVNVGQSP